MHANTKTLTIVSQQKWKLSVKKMLSNLTSNPTLLSAHESHNWLKIWHNFPPRVLIEEISIANLWLKRKRNIKKVIKKLKAKKKLWNKKFRQWKKFCEKYIKKISIQGCHENWLKYHAISLFFHIIFFSKRSNKKVVKGNVVDGGNYTCNMIIAWQW